MKHDAVVRTVIKHEYVSGPHQDNQRQQDVPGLGSKPYPEIDASHQYQNEDRYDVEQKKRDITSQSMKQRPADAAGQQDRQADAKKEVLPVLAAHAPDPVQRQQDEYRCGDRVTRLDDPAAEIG